MAKQLSKRSDIERKVAAGEAVKEQPRQVIRETSTGRIISNKRMPEMLPTYLIAVQSNTLVYNDIDVESFHREVRQQVSRILDAIRDERFDNAGIAYQQFIDQYDSCFEMPSSELLRMVKQRGVDLYAVLEGLGTRLTDEMRIESRPGEQTEHRFNAVTDAHINLFFYMLTLNLAIHNKIDSVQKQLRTKLSFLEERLRTLLREYIHADQRGALYQGDIPASRTLYGWILLEQNDLDTARGIFKNDPDLNNHMSFAKLHAEVMNIYQGRSRNYTPKELRDDEFRSRGLSDARVRIALKLCYYLNQINQIRMYIDELTQGSDNKDTNEATVDVQSQLLARNE